MPTLKDEPTKAFYAPSPVPGDFLPWPPLPTPNHLPPISDDDEKLIAGCAVTLLDPDEIPDHPPRAVLPAPVQLPECPSSSFRHSGWTDVRRRVYAALRVSGAAESRLRRFAECGNAAWVEAGYERDHVAGRGLEAPIVKHRIKCNTCRDRFCVPCAGARARIVARTLVAQLAGEPARFITLTRKHTDAPLRDQIDGLYTSYKRLRKTVLWQRGVYAAAAILELTRNPDTHTWHPHLHVLAKGKYVPHADLKAEWNRITADSFIVHISLIRDPAKTAAYIAKYVTKPMVQTYSTDQPAVIEAIQAMHHRRTVLLTGDWQKLTWEKQTDDLLWSYVGTLDSLLHRALAGEPDAVAILTSLRKDERWKTQETGPAP
jgi:hypothetical protein